MKFAKLYLLFSPIPCELKNCSKNVKIHQSGKIVPHLVTLNSQVKAGGFGRLKRPAATDPLCSKYYKVNWIWSLDCLQTSTDRYSLLYDFIFPGMKKWLKLVFAQLFLSKGTYVTSVANVVEMDNVLNVCRVISAHQCSFTGSWGLV